MIDDPLLINGTGVIGKLYRISLALAVSADFGTKSGVARWVDGPRPVCFHLEIREFRHGFVFQNLGDRSQAFSVHSKSTKVLRQNRLGPSLCRALAQVPIGRFPSRV
jgi:hypothetical protein